MSQSSFLRGDLLSEVRVLLSEVRILLSEVHVLLSEVRVLLSEVHVPPLKLIYLPASIIQIALILAGHPPKDTHEHYFTDGPCSWKV